MKGLRRINTSWADRPDSFEVCVQQILDFLKLLRDHNPAVFGTWYGITHAPDKEAVRSKPLSWSHEGLKKEFKAVSYPEKDPSKMELFFDLTLWNGKDHPEELGFLTSLGGASYNRGGSPNYCGLLWAEGAQAYTCYGPEGKAQEALLALFRDYWDPVFIRLEGRDGSLQKGLYTFFDEHELSEAPLPEEMYKPPATSWVARLWQRVRRFFS